ncbi:MAG: DUF4445 domain-containing protein [Ruminococcus sp.]|nr:DUF4445 domain-containing protein [Ruminococcus sp.]
MQLIIPAGVNILEYIRNKGLSLPAHCSGAGVCGKCVIRVLAGSIDISSADRALLDEAQLKMGMRLACKALTKAPVRIELPDAQSGYNSPDRKWGEPDKAHAFGIAADIGTTTVALSLVDITDKRAVRTVTLTNSAAAYGADVITRIGSALSGKGAAIKSAMQADLAAGIEALGCTGLDVRKMSIAANTAMYHLLLGLDCTGLAKAPFAPVTLGGERLTLSEITGQKAALAEIPVTLIKGISAFIGGDISSGLACTETAGSTLFLDLGTNGEAALITRDGIVCASAAAGPALEGGQLRFGMGGVKGAICRVYDKDGGIAFDTVENAPAAGICGSGAVDALALCVRRGLIDEQGVFVDSLFEGGLKLTESIALTQQDIRELQLAKAAIRACLDTLLEHAHTEYADIDRLVIAGGFGHYLDIDSACDIGLIPKELKGKAVTLGNTSLRGAEVSLYDEGFFGRLEALTKSAVTLPLSEDEGFKGRFIGNIGFSVR